MGEKIAHSLRCHQQTRALSALFSRDHYSVELVGGSVSASGDALVRIGVTPAFTTLPPFPSNDSFDIERVDVEASAQERTEMLKGNLLSTDPSSVIVKIFWSGYKISDGDELYHTVWENSSGVVEIRRPSEVPKDSKFDLHSFNFEHIGRVGQTTLTHWLFTARTSPTLLDALMTTDEYLEYTERLNSAEEVEEHEGYSGYGLDGDTTLNDMEKLKTELRRRSGSGSGSGAKESNSS